MTRKIIATLAVGLVGLLGITGPAHASDSNLDPAEVSVMPHEAQEMADLFTRQYFAAGLPRPHWYEVDKCHGGLLRWRCPFRAGTFGETKCSGVMWLSADELNYYFTWHHLRCRPA
jgi:hypothetical protein